MLTSSGFPTAAAQVLRRLLELHGVDADALADAAGVRLADMQFVDGLTSGAAIDALLLAALERTGDPSFGLSAARCWHPSYFGVLGHAWLVSPTLAVGLRRVAEFYVLVGERGTVEVDPGPDGVTVRFWGHRGSPAALESAAIAVDIVLSMLLDMCRYNAGDALRPLRATLRRHRPDPPDAYERFFGCAVEFDAADNTFVLANRDALLPRSVGNRRLASTFDRMLAEDLSRWRHDDVAGQCRAAISNRLPTGQVDASDVAAMLHLTPRTLQRRLAKAGQTFQAVLDDVRRGFAVQYVEELRRPLTEVAFLLGFQQLSSFTRAFRRWHGCTPSQYRARLPG